MALNLGSQAVTWGEIVLGSAGLALALLLLVTVLLVKVRRERAIEAAIAAERADEMEEQVAEITRLQAEMTGRMQTMAEVFGARQSDLVRLMAERIDGLQHRVGQGIAASAEHQSEHLDRKSTRLNSSHANISYAVFCLKKKKTYDLKSSTDYNTINQSFIQNALSCSVYWTMM